MVLVGDYRYHSGCVYDNGMALAYVVVMYCDDLCGWGWYTGWGSCDGLAWCVLLGLGRVGVELVVVHTPLMIRERRTRLPKEAVCTNTGAQGGF